jgi:hypothetical protein
MGKCALAMTGGRRAGLPEDCGGVWEYAAVAGDENLLSAWREEGLQVIDTQTWTSRRHARPRTGSVGGSAYRRAASRR